MQELFTKYLNNDCSPAEVNQLLAHFNFPENETILRQLIIGSLESINADDDESQWTSATDEVFLLIKKNLNQEKGKVVPVFKRTWFKVAAAAILIIAAFSAYYLISDKNEEKPIATITNSKTETAKGNSKAVLTLADGTNIDLETAANGALTQQGQTKIAKNTDGELTYTSINENAKGIFINSITTSKGGQYKVILADGSKVWLNAASSLRFPASFTGNERIVELSGEAYFEVAKNVAMPFKLEVNGKSEIEVLGTHFNVNAYTDEENINTTLLEGSVKVIAVTNRNSKTLNPGQQAQLFDNGSILVIKNAETEQIIAWKDGVFSFSNANLGIVFRQLSRWYDVDIKFNGPVPVRKFSGEIQRSLELTQVLKILNKNNVSCRLEGKTIIVGK